MSLSKGFLLRPMVFGQEFRVRLVLSSIIWISFSFILYTFTNVLREMLRLIVSVLGEPLVLTKAESFLFNCFFASLALSISFGYVFHLFWLNPVIRSRDVRFKKSLIVTEMSSLNFFVLFMVAKFGIIYVAMLTFGPVFIFFSLSEYPLVMLMLPLVIFGYQWSTINRVFLMDGVKWMLYVMVALVVLSFLFAYVPVIDHKKLNKVLLSASPAGHFRWELPPRFDEAIEEYSAHYEFMEVKIYAGYPLDSPEEGSVVFVGNPPFDPLDHRTFSGTVDDIKDQFMEYEREALAAQLFIDRHTQMKGVKELKMLLFQEGIRRVFLALKNEAVLYGSDNRFYFRQSVHYCDTTYNLNFDFPDDFGGPIPPPCFEGRVTPPAGMLVLLKSGEIFVDGVVENSDGIRLKVAKFLADGEGKAVIRFWSDDISTYEDYLGMYNSILAGYRDVLDAYLMKHFSTSYRDCLRKPFDGSSIEARKAAHQKFPQMLFDLSDQEKHLLIRNVPELTPFFGVK